MDLNYVLYTLLKILISTPSVLVLSSYGLSAAHGAALLTDSSGSGKNSTNISAPYYDYEFADSQELDDVSKEDNNKNNEDIPDPSPLVLPGYNLPENIFNHGKPFYVDKDPLTGHLDFRQKSTTPNGDGDDLYDYVEEPSSSDIYDKSNIDRKDGSLGSHRPSDVNQLTPNFHDFLNLPVKYNPAKYVYPLISSSYASTKYQGSVNKFHNHKDYPVKMTTKKPPTYYSTEKYFKITYSTTSPTTTTTTTTRPITTTAPKRQETTKNVNLLNTAMGVGFSEDYDDYYDSTVVTTTNKPTTTSKRYTPTSTEYFKTYTTSKPPSTTTNKVLSLFEQLFGEYEDEPLATSSTTIKTTVAHKKPTEITSTTAGTPSSSTTSSTTTKIISLLPQQVTVTSSTEHYEYEDIGDNVAVESKPIASTDVSKVVAQQPHVTERPLEVATSLKFTDYYEDYYSEDASTKKSTVTPKVTSLPIGDNHLTTSGYDASFKRRDPIIVATQNLREKLNGEKVAPRPFVKPNQSNVHIGPDQNTVSFVLGDRQNVDGGYRGTAFKDSPYDVHPIRPYNDDKEITLQGTMTFPRETVGSAVTIQPLRNSEASLAIGVPVNGIDKQTPGQVLDETLELRRQQATPHDGKVVFPVDLQPEYPNFAPPPSDGNREVLQLSSQPLHHQLPSDLTPPREPQPAVLKRPYSRPPWDPRPGHFYSGNPEYNRPPRPHGEVAYKRIDNLPNVLPQFRPNTNSLNKPPGYFDKKFNRQPLLDRPSNRPISFFEKLHPPPPPPPLYLGHNSLPSLRNKNVSPPRQSSDDNLGNASEDRVISDDQPGMYQTPPQIKIANRRADSDVMEVETLQMIQAKVDKRNKEPVFVESVIDDQPKIKTKENHEKTIYKVYPVNSAPIKLDVIDDSNKKETVVIGTRSERPLPPSKISPDFDLFFDSKDRNDDPILKPHKPATFPVKTDFPYPLERPGLDSGLNLNPVPEAASKNGNDLEEPDYFSNNQWNTIADYEPKIVNGQKITGINQISVTLKTHTERPIAVAYTPTEPNLIADKYSMPNYGSPVIPEIRVGDSSNKVFTVSAVMHTHQQNPHGNEQKADEVHKSEAVSSQNHRNGVDLPDYPKLEFEAPFQASLNVDGSTNQGWSVVVRNRNATTTESSEATTLPYATTSEFDIENFKPQLEGGFKPIFDFPENGKKFVETKVSDRDE